jgi:flagellar motor switch protein FliM
VQPASIVDHLLDAPVDVTLRFRPITMRAGDLVHLEEGQIIGLEHRTNVPLALDVEGTEVLAAKPGRLGRRLACVIVDPVIDLGATST